MKICLIAEGCYPYVAGGVSSWVQMLMEGMPQHQFVLYTIGAEERQRGRRTWWRSTRIFWTSTGIRKPGTAPRTACRSGSGRPWWT